jgi:hypothetical protein
LVGFGPVPQHLTVNLKVSFESSGTVRYILHLQIPSEPSPTQLPQPKDTVARHQVILKYGPPTTGIPTILTYENHVLEYDTARRVPKVSNGNGIGNYFPTKANFTIEFYCPLPFIFNFYLLLIFFLYFYLLSLILI